MVRARFFMPVIVRVVTPARYWTVVLRPVLRPTSYGRLDGLRRSVLAMNTTRTRVLSIVLAAATTIGVLGAGTAHARDGDVVMRGDCTARSDWKLKASPRDTRIKAEFEVGSHIPGQVWNVMLAHNGTTVVDRTATTADNGE